jgi:prepilin-type N-terminal cleavage/methylation domain-containing protein
MVLALRRRLRLDESPESGLSLIEVIVAMLIFAIIALGVEFSIVSTLRSAKDAKGREVALNLAAQEIDAVRAISDIFLIGDSTRTVNNIPGDATVYTITRTADWVTARGSTADCGAGGGNLQYKQVNVQITWDSMIRNNPVRADTIVAPKTTINDPSLGTILVSTKNAAGTGVAGVTVTASPSTGTTPPVTDADGCSYLLKVPPGTYTVTASKSTYIDVNQVTSPTSTLTVTAGSIASAAFAYDVAGSVGLKYASNYTSSTASLPTNMVTTFTSTVGGSDLMTGTSAFKLFPASSYTYVAGGYLPATTSSPGCLDVDPSQWPDGIDSSGQGTDGQALTAPDPNVLSFLPGATLTGQKLPMGVVSLKTGGGSVYVKATVTTPPSGSDDPGCAATPAATYTFGPLTPSSSKVLIALPYGSYTIKTGNSLTNLVGLAVSNILAPSGFTGFSVTSGGVVTLDPRVVGP